MRTPSLPIPVTDTSRIVHRRALAEALSPTSMPLLVCVPLLVTENPANVTDCPVARKTTLSFVILNVVAPGPAPTKDFPAETSVRALILNVPGGAVQYVTAAKAAATAAVESTAPSLSAPN